MNEIALGVLLLFTPISVPTPAHQIAVERYGYSVELTSVDADWDHAAGPILNDALWAWAPSLLAQFTTVKVMPMQVNNDPNCVRRVRWAVVFTSNDIISYTIIIHPDSLADGTFDESLQEAFGKMWTILRGTAAPSGLLYPGCLN